jgi:NADH-ubiquinone oxidoreductase chain 4
LLNNISLFYCTIAMWGGSILRVVCLRHRDMKVLIAYSSVVHMALVIAGILSSNSWGIEGGMIIMVAHGACSSGIFAQANIIYERSHSRRLILNKGYLNMFPFIRLLWFILIVGNFGGPFTLNLAGEILLIIRVINMSFLFWLMVRFLRFFSAAYRLVLYSSTQQGVSTSSLIMAYDITIREVALIFNHSWLFLLLIISPLIT